MQTCKFYNIILSIRRILLKVNNHIENIYRDLLIHENLEYSELYESFKHIKLIGIFSTIHSLLIKNYKKMNERLPTGENTDHFWAENSRKLITAIESIESLQRGLKNTHYSFFIDSYFGKVINKSARFLSKRNGSEIPSFMEKVDLYYKIPIFISQDIMEIESLNESINVETKLIGEGSYAHVYKYKDPFLEKKLL